MVEHLTALRDAIRAVAHSDAQQPDLLRLVHISKVMMRAHLIHLRPNAAELIRSSGFSIDDVVDDCITEMFGQIRAGRVPFIDTFVESMETPMERLPAVNVFISYRTMLQHRVEAQLAYLYYQNDSLNGRIHRAIQDAVRTEKTGLALAKDFRGLYLYPVGHDRLEEKPPFTIDEILRVLATRLVGSLTLVGILLQMSGILIEQSARSRTIPVVDSVQVVRRWENRITGVITGDQLSTDGLDNDQCEEICRLATTAIQRKIVLTYLIDGKLTKAEAEGLSDAMSELIRMMVFESASRMMLHEHVRRYLSVSPGEYEDRLRPKAEFLANLAEHEVAARLLREL